jgi:hypothetical protein
MSMTAGRDLHTKRRQTIHLACRFNDPSLEELEMSMVKCGLSVAQASYFSGCDSGGQPWQAKHK